MVGVGSRLVVSAFFAPDLINVINVTVHSAWWVQDLDVNLRIDWTQHVCHLICRRVDAIAKSPWTLCAWLV